MKLLISLSLLVAVVSAGTLSNLQQRLPLEPVVPSQELDGRITSGDLAKAGQFPYQVGLTLIFGETTSWCGGTLISDRWILTAAHCTTGVDGVIAYLGAIDKTDDNEKGQNRIYISKAYIIVHADWDHMTVRNDISLIKLPVVIEFNGRIQPATLPKKSGEYSTYDGDMVWASGWGKESDDAATYGGPLLRYIKVPIMKQSSCSKYFSQITEKMICIDGENGKSICSGDSGGPLVYKDGDINYVIGVTSFVTNLGCEKGWPAVFTRVTSYLDWIEEKTGVVNK